MESVIELAQATYDRIAAGYDDRWTRHTRAPQERLTRGLRLAPGERCADLGCGTGLDTIEMLKRVAPGEVVGVDCSREMLRAAAARAAAEGLPLTALPAAAEEIIASADDASFDVVTLRFCLAYLDWREALPRLGRVVRPGGRVGVLTNLASSAPQAYAVYRRLSDELGLRKVPLPVPDTVDQIRRALAQGGLRVVEAWQHELRLWFESGAEAARWLEESGFVTHPALREIPAEALEALVAIFAARLEQHREARGIPLDFELAGVVARKP